jgi:hypothetical protein
MTDRNRVRQPSSAEGEIIERDPIVEASDSDRETDREIYGSEGGGGDNVRSHPRERKRKS